MQNFPEMRGKGTFLACMIDYDKIFHAFFIAGITSCILHIHDQTLLNSICGSYFQEFLGQTFKMLVHQKETF